MFLYQNIFLFKFCGKGNANRVENKMNLFIFYPEMPLTLYKGNANRVENKMNLFIFYPEMPLTLYKEVQKSDSVR